MLTALARLPLILLLAAVGGGAMLVPAAQALASGDMRLARVFALAAGASLLIVTLIALATTATPSRPASGSSRIGRSHGGLASLAAAFTLLPAMLALPLSWALPDTGFLNAWWEMLSCLTATGASLYDPDRLPPPLHLWRGLVGWLGGLLTLAAAVAILAPLQVGGFELVAEPLSPAPVPAQAGKRAAGSAPLTSSRARNRTAAQASEAETWRVLRAVRSLLPLYGGATLALWTGLTMTGDNGFNALMRAMGTISTSGIAAAARAGASGGWGGEAMIFAILCLALSRRFWPGGELLRTSRRMRDDPELRLAAAVITAVALAVLLRHAVGAAERTGPDTGGLQAIANGLAVLWGAGFTALSFLTTTGWTASDWQGAVVWSGLEEPGLILAGLAIVGGGAATAAGGAKLLRIAALARHGGHEMERIIHPAVIAGGGATWRRLRGPGAFLAFITFMLFAQAIAVVVLLVSLQRVEVETATVLAVAALTNTGPLMQVVAVGPGLGGGAGIAGAPWEGWAGLQGATKGVLAIAMALGRLEILAVLALLSPGYWRR